MKSDLDAVLSGERQWVVLHADNAEMLPLLPDKSVAHVITDPPYSTAVHSKQWVSAALTADGAPRVSSKHRGIDFDALTGEQMAFVAGRAHALASRWSLIFSDIESVSLWRGELEAAGLDYVRTCIWDKVDSSPQFTGDRPASACEGIVLAHQPGRKRWNGGGRRNVFSVPVNGSERGDKPHPTTKPLALMLELVELFTDPGEVVLDPFAGSSTTGVACLRLGRRFIGIERSEQYARVAVERMRAEEQGQSLREYRAGQLPLLGAP